MKELILIDGNALIHAAWHAYPESLGGDGRNYNVIHGVLSKINRLDRYCQWDDLIVVFDPEEGSLYRKSLFMDYKANRPKKEEGLVYQINLIEEVLQDFGMKTIKVSGVESDDVMGTLANVYVKKGFKVKIVTHDKDLSQLVNPWVKLLRVVKGEEGIATPFDLIDEEGVYLKFGVYPGQIADWLALIGDTVDNIPGVKGVGPKKATALLSQYGNLKMLIENKDKIPGKVGEALREQSDLLPTLLQLTTIQSQLDTSDWNIKQGWSPEKQKHWIQTLKLPEKIHQLSWCR